MFPDRNDIQIFVPINYKYDLFCNRTVIKSINNINLRRTIACRHKKSNVISFLLY